MRKLFLIILFFWSGFVIAQPLKALVAKKAGITYSPLDPSKKGSSTTLSVGNTRADFTSYNQVLTVVALTRDCQFEMSMNSPVIGVAIGVAKSTANLNNFCGFDANGYGYLSLGYIFNNNSPLQTVSSYNQSNIVGCSYTYSTNTVKFWKGGVQQGTAVTLSAGTYYAVVSSQAASAESTNFITGTTTYTMEGYSGVY